MRLDWVMIYVGFKNHYLDSEEVCNLSTNRDLSLIDETSFIDLEVTKRSDVEFLYILERNAVSFCEFNKSDFDSECEKSAKIWHLEFLQKIANSSGDIADKLNQIESLWARFNYPSEWENFIYYLPKDISTIKSKESVYENFLTFLALKNSLS